MTNNIKVSIDAGVLTLTLDRPEKKNALTQVMYGAMAEQIRGAMLDTEIRVILIQGSEECFTSGNDLKEFTSPGFTDRGSPVERFLTAVYECEKPIIAAVAGNAIGVGTTLLFHCDLVFAADTSYFEMPFVNLGLTPEFASSYLLPLLVGHVKASEWLLLGKGFDAAEALRCGVVNRVVPAREVLSLALDSAKILAGKPPGAVRQTKALLRKHRYNVGKDIMVEELDIFRAGLESPEFAEALNAFIEKRPADFSSFN